MCFDLAHFYRLDPDVFLAKPIAELPFYLEHTRRLQKRMR